MQNGIEQTLYENNKDTETQIAQQSRQIVTFLLHF